MKRLVLIIINFIFVFSSYTQFSCNIVSNRSDWPLIMAYDLWDDVYPDQEVYAPSGWNEYGQWALIFEEEFNQDIDPEIWLKRFSWGRYLDDAAEYMLDDNVIVSNGTLKLRAEQEQITDPSSSQTFNYSSGIIWSKKHTGYGIYEIKCKFPDKIGKANHGLQPAFWLWSNNICPITNSNTNNEIDIFEFFGSNSRIDFATHADCFDCGTEVDYPNNYFNNDIFHIITLHYTPLYIKWYVDGVLKYSFYRYYNTFSGDAAVEQISTNPAVVYAFRVNYPDPILDLIISLGVPFGVDNTILPNQQFEIEYVRYYNKIDCSSKKVINQDYITNGYLDPNYNNLIMGDTIILDGLDFNISSLKLEVIATKEIIFQNDFINNFNGEFEYRIDEHACDEVDIPLISAKNEIQELDYLDEYIINEHSNLLFDFNYNNNQIYIQKLPSEELLNYNFSIIIYDILGRIYYESSNDFSINKVINVENYNLPQRFFINLHNNYYEKTHLYNK